MDGHQEALFLMASPASPPSVPLSVGSDKPCRNPEKGVQPSSRKYCRLLWKLLGCLHPHRVSSISSTLPLGWEVGLEQGPPFCPMQPGICSFLSTAGTVDMFKPAGKKQMWDGRKQTPAPSWRPARAGDRVFGVTPTFPVLLPESTGFHKHHVAQFRLSGTEPLRCVLITET